MKLRNSSAQARVSRRATTTKHHNANRKISHALIKTTTAATKVYNKRDSPPRRSPIRSLSSSATSRAASSAASRQILTRSSTAKRPRTTTKRILRSQNSNLNADLIVDPVGSKPVQVSLVTKDEISCSNSPPTYPQNLLSVVVVDNTNSNSGAATSALIITEPVVSIPQEIPGKSSKRIKKKCTTNKKRIKKPCKRSRKRSKPTVCTLINPEPEVETKSFPSISDHNYHLKSLPNNNPLDNLFLGEVTPEGLIGFGIEASCGSSAMSSEAGPVLTQLPLATLGSGGGANLNNINIRPAEGDYSCAFNYDDDDFNMFAEEYCPNGAMMISSPAVVAPTALEGSSCSSTSSSSSSSGGGGSGGFMSSEISSEISEMFTSSSINYSSSTSSNCWTSTSTSGSINVNSLKTCNSTITTNEMTIGANNFCTATASSSSTSREVSSATTTATASTTITKITSSEDPLLINSQGTLLLSRSSSSEETSLKKSECEECEKCIRDCCNCNFVVDCDIEMEQEQQNKVPSCSSSSSSSNSNNSQQQLQLQQMQQMQQYNPQEQPVDDSLITSCTQQSSTATLTYNNGYVTSKLHIFLIAQKSINL